MSKSAGCMTLFMLLLCGSVRLGAQKPAPSFDADVLTFYKLADGQVISTTGHTYRGSDGRTREDTAQGSVIIDPKGRTVTLKVKFADFEIITRSRSVANAVASREDLERLSVALLQSEMPLPKPVRLLGVSLSSLQENDEGAEAQLALLI